MELLGQVGAWPYDEQIQVCEHPARRWTQENLSPHRRSKPILAILNEHLHRGNHPVSVDTSQTGFEIRPLNGAWNWRTGDEIANDFSALSDFNVNACAEPFLDLLGVAELAEGDSLHGSNVTQNVTHCQFVGQGSPNAF